VISDIKYYFYFLVVLSIISCERGDNLSVELCYSNPELSINDVRRFQDNLSFVVGDTWTQGNVLFADQSMCDSNIQLSVNALLSLDTEGNNIYSVGMNNNIWHFDAFNWHERVIDSNLVMRDIVVSDDHLILAGGLAFFQGYIQVVSKSNFKLLTSQRFEQQLNAVACTQTGKCLAVGYGVVYKSDDSGLSWQLSTEHPTDHFIDIELGSEDVFYILGSSGRVLMSIDGNEFVDLGTGSNFAGDYRDICISEDLKLILGAEQGKLDIYDIKQDKWSNYKIGNQHDIFCVSTFDDQIYIGTRQGEILKLNI